MAVRKYDNDKDYSGYWDTLMTLHKPWKKL